MREGPASLDAVCAASKVLGATRPTAVNLHWALERMERRAAASTPERLAADLRDEASAIWDEDRAMCARIGEAGAALIGGDALVLTHCNAGALATGGIGTALAPVYTLHAAGRRVAVVADETRPLLQGSRLTAWELSRAGVPVTVIADGMAASRLRRGDVTCVIVGADRIAANGDVANKIGTYGVALAARAHGVPFYVAAPDVDDRSGDARRRRHSDRGARGGGGGGMAGAHGGAGRGDRVEPGVRRDARGAGDGDHHRSRRVRAPGRGEGGVSLARPRPCSKVPPSRRRPS